MDLLSYARNLLSACPHIQGATVQVNTDFLDGAPLDSGGAENRELSARQYLDGGSVRRFCFTLALTQDMQNDAQRIANRALCEDVALWLEQRTFTHALLPIGDGLAPLAIRAITGPKACKRPDNSDLSIYIMQIELTYYQKGRN